MPGSGRAIAINLALQGGGAHGAFTWGVLDRLLESPDIAIRCISATSAGAVNAVAVASGLATEGQESARTRLRTLWEGVAKAGVPDLLRLNPFLNGLARSGNLAPVFSPYEFNPLGFDPLRRLIEAACDFAAIRSGPVELLIAATDVATGRARLFRRPEMTVEAVLASACLPQLHHAVEIDGRAYWDGGFSANPDLVTLALESPCRDTLLVQLNPIETRNVPRTARDIAAHVNRLTFNAPLLRDIEAIVAARATARSWLGRRADPRAARLADHRFHLIEAGRHTSGLAADSKVRPDAGLLTYLHGAGRIEAEKWLHRVKDDLGRRETVDLAAHYIDRFGPR